MIKIQKNPEIKLDIPSFSCDNDAVGKHLNDHPLTELLNVYGFLCVIGRPGAGKTSFTISLITQKNPKIYKKTHHHILVVMPENSISSMKKNPFKMLPKENIYDDLTDSTISSIYSKIDGWSKSDEKTILFIDDCTASLKASKHIQETLKKIVFNRRHLKCNMIITAQSYVNLPMDIRKCIQNLIMFKPSKLELERVFNELVESKKENFMDIMRIAYNDPHNFLFINIPTQRIFRNWDELILPDEDQNDNSDIEKEL